jgi:hypothetical protein
MGLISFDMAMSGALLLYLLPIGHRVRLPDWTRRLAPRALPAWARRPDSSPAAPATDLATPDLATS